MPNEAGHQVGLYDMEFRTPLRIHGWWFDDSFFKIPISPCCLHFFTHSIITPIYSIFSDREEWVASRRGRVHGQDGDQAGTHTPCMHSG